MLVLKYRDPDEPGLINYLNLHHDLLALAQRDAESAKLGGFPNFKSATEYLPTQVGVRWKFDVISLGHVECVG